MTHPNKSATAPTIAVTPPIKVKAIQNDGYPPPH